MLKVVDWFKGCLLQVAMPFRPYFYVITRPEVQQDVTTFLTKKYSGQIAGVEIIKKEDLDLVIK